MSDAELFAMGIFVGMGSYISYLRYELGKVKAVLGMTLMLIGDIADKDVEIERTPDGIRIRKPRVDREVS